MDIGNNRQDIKDGDWCHIQDFFEPTHSLLLVLFAIIKSIIHVDCPQTHVYMWGYFYIEKSIKYLQ